MEVIIAALLSVINSIVKELTGKVWEQFKLEDKVDDTDTVLDKIELLDDAELNADLLGDAGWVLPDPDGVPLPTGNPLA